MIGNENADKITKVPKSSPQNSSGTVANETENIGFYREIPKEEYLSQKKAANY